MRVVGMRVLCMMMVVVVVMMMVMIVMVMIVAMVVVMMMMVMVVHHLQPTKPCAERITKLTIFDVRARGRGPLPFNMVVVAFLNRTNLCLEAKHLRAILAHHACWRRNVTKCWMACALSDGNSSALSRCDLTYFFPFDGQNLGAVLTGTTVRRWYLAYLFSHSFNEGFQNFGVITQIGSLYELNVRMLCRYLISKTVDAVDQDA